ncbi:methyltransferase domain-containing protein [Nostoc sp. UHCC 0870]|uniref:methyltransferase domain-containing protein n=1 Tax=Nostoc sp. UHCC 0870 TaxID=2914041 RepID=UPI001EDEBE02|nr:methyltransferase domain-containing protein [Nostoc sp. UHCC 0870]UKO98157.1 glycosyltransferase [Nostoc sp. UHCC 0870]
MSTKCKVCQSQSIFFAEAILLGKHKVNYFQCSNCGFVQTEEPYWLAEAYSDAIAKTDVGLVFRNHHLSQKASQIIFQLFDHNAKFLDYGGGYGLFVRQMRDYGFNFYWFDKFCNNLFAQGFEIDKNENNNYELVTAFEVFEHFVDPVQEIEHILQFSRNILFSTEILPENNPKPNEWWYYATHEGQHISLYTFASLSIIADRYNLNFYSNGTSLHLLTEKKLLPDMFHNVCHSQPQSLKKESLLANDYSQAVKSLINNYYPNFAECSTKESDLTESATKNITILIDGVFFQLYQTGIARVWKSLLEEWASNGFAKQIIVLDRVGTAPKIAGIRYLNIPSYDYHDIDTDRAMLQQVCEQEGADLFISSYYTTPLTTPSVFMAYDMIPEVMGWDMNNPMWQAKHQAIKQAQAYIAISENTAHDLAKFFSHIPQESVTVAYCGVKYPLLPASSSKVNSFKTKYGITKPYFLLVGTGSGYKNGILFFQAFSQLASGSGFDIVCTGIGTALTSEFRAYTSGSVVHTLQLSDEDLAIAYSGAVALVYPSKYEGFGMPIIEAMACGCPVITCPNASIPEVAGDAAIYVNNDVDGLVNALCEVQKPGVRQLLITAGLAQIQKFSWSKMAEIVSSALIDATLLSLNLKEINLIVFPDWSESEDLISLELAQVIKTIATHSESSKTTLLIDTTNILAEDAELFLSSITMSLLMEEDLDITNELEITLVINLADIQWKALLPRLHGRIILEQENQQALIQAKAETLTSYELESFRQVRDEEFFFA